MILRHYAFNYKKMTVRVTTLKYIFFLLFIVNQSLRAQSLMVGSFGDQYLKSLQLQGKLPLNQSLTSRPFLATSPSQYDSFFKLIDTGFRQSKSKKVSLIDFRVLPATLTLKNNTDHPYGWNENGLLSAPGLQTRYSGGFFAKAGPLTVQLIPEFFTAQNTKYEINEFYGTIPNNKLYNKTYWGQSSVRLNFLGFSAGISSENIYWGPGQFNALLMSNNAPGFLHYTINTTKPIKTPIGSFETQVILGRLNQDTAMPFENNYLKKVPSFRFNRFYSGLNFSFQPKWVPNFFIGINRSFQYREIDANKSGASFAQKYVPIFDKIFKSSLGGTQEDSIPRDQQVSLFTRWLFPKTHSEFYFEYGWNDHSYNFRDFWIDPEHSAAYLVGFKHLAPLSRDRWIEYTTEITQMAQTPDMLTRNAGNWYIYENGGYMHDNKILGAGSGMGNNVQTLQVRLLDKWDIIGIKIQRIQHEPVSHFAYWPLETIGQRPFKWTDIGLGLSGQKKLDNFLISGEVQYVKSNHYAWAQDNRTNLYFLLHLNYLW